MWQPADKYKGELTNLNDTFKSLKGELEDKAAKVV